MPVNTISVLGRITSGVKLIDMEDDIKVAGIAKVREEIEEEQSEVAKETSENSEETLE